MRRIALLLLLTLPLYATPPCPSSPCLDYPSGKLNPEKCDAASDWKAEGHVTKLEHHPAGYPLNKDFQTFTFVVDRWIRGGDWSITEIPFQVGWCRNSQEVRSTEGRFIFWGKNKPPVENAEWEFVHFEQILPLRMKK